MTTEQDPKPQKYISPQETIALRNSWLRIGVIGSLTAVLVVKLWQADFTQAFSGFDFSNLLSLFLAMFSIGLAVLFYLKATETSNVFYDNTYRFTKDVSEILGRVEAGFGERLKHLDEGYTGLKTAVENIPPLDKATVKKEIEEEEEQLQKVEQERAELFEDLANRAQLQKEEKDTLFERLNTQEKELAIARQEVQILKLQMQQAEREEAKREGQLVIDFAEYGTHDKKVDVTQILHSKISRGRLEIIASNDSFSDDPAPGRVKELKVIYLYAGKKYSMSVPENETLILPPRNLSLF